MKMSIEKQIRSFPKKKCGGRKIGYGMSVGQIEEIQKSIVNNTNEVLNIIDCGNQAPEFPKYLS